MSLNRITEKEVLEAQEKWASGVMAIGKKCKNKEDYSAFAEIFINTIYGFRMGEILFKPTLARETQFRLTKKAVLSYYVGGNSDFTEDIGFALIDWKAIRFENKRIRIEGKIAMAMGNYFFKRDSAETKVEYTFVYKKDDEENLYIILHDSHIPYISGIFPFIPTK